MYYSWHLAIILALVAALVLTTHGHTQVYNAGINGKLGADFQYQIENNYGNGPIEDVSSTDLRCRSKDGLSGNGVDKLVIDAGEKLDIRWRHYNNSVSVPVMSRSHVGPCMVYMAPLSSQGEGNVWFKVFEQGWDTEAKQWCTVMVIDNDGFFDVTIPAEIPSGDYIVRAELLALHKASKEGGAQFYPNCLVVTVNNGRASSQPKGYAIPGIYTPKDPGILYNRSSDPNTYIIPGPPLFVPESSNVQPTSTTIHDNEPTSLVIETPSSPLPVHSSPLPLSQTKCKPRLPSTKKCRHLNRRFAKQHVKM